VVDLVFAPLFFAPLFFAPLFFAEDFFAALFFAEDFFAALFFAPLFLAPLFLAEDFFAGDFLRVVAFFDFRSRAIAVPATAAPSAAAPAAASIGFSATVDATFFAPLPMADAASPAVSVTVSMGPLLSDMSVLLPPNPVVRVPL
jgi:hypothetical protein